jgi:DNA-binding beta-propeller fold protein YncE
MEFAMDHHTAWAAAAASRAVPPSRRGRVAALFAAAALALHAGCASSERDDDPLDAGPVAKDVGDSPSPLTIRALLADPVAAIPAAGEGAITLAGSAEPGREDGAGASARFNNPTNVVVGPDGNVYVADFDNGLIRLVRPSGATITLTRQPGFSHPFGMAIAPNGALYVETDSDDAGRRDDGSGMIWRVDRNTGAATPLLRGLGRPRGLAVLSDGRIVMVDNVHHVVRVLDPATLGVSDLAGARDQRGFVDGVGAAARFDHPYDVVLTRDGVLLVADQDNHRLRAITLQGVVSTYAGTGARGSQNGSRDQATFNRPQGLALDDRGDVYVTDLDGYVVRRVSAQGIVSTVAGSGREGFADGAPLLARFSGMEGLDVSPVGRTLFVADGNRGSAARNHRVRRISLGPLEG